MTDRDEIFRFLSARDPARRVRRDARDAREANKRGRRGGRGGKRAQKGAERDEEGIRVAASQRGALPRGPRSFSYSRLIACALRLYRTYNAL